MSFSVTRLTRIGLLTALSLAGALVKIPSLLGTPALDSAPSYLAALAFGGTEGALVAALGHLATALYAGFPLSLPIHLAVTGLMALAALATAWAYRRWGLLAGIVAGVLVNGLLAPAALIPVLGLPFFQAATPVLLVASGLNLALAGAVFSILRRNGRLPA